MKKKKILIILIVVITIAAAIAITLVSLGIKGKRQETVLTDNNEDDQVSIIYIKKLEEIDDSMEYSLVYSQIGSEPKMICPYVSGFEVGFNGEMIVYTLSGDSYVKKDAYLIDSEGYSQLLSKNVTTYELSSSRNTVAYLVYGKDDRLFIKEYSEEWELENKSIVKTDVSFIKWHMSNNGRYVAITQKLHEQNKDQYDGDYNPYNFNWVDIVLCYNGKAEKIAEKAFLSNTRQCVSNDGSVLYIGDVNEEAGSGMLYLKRLGEEPELIIEDTQDNFSISDDGSLIYASIIKDGEDALFYQFDGQDSVIVENILMGIMSQNSNTIVYAVKQADGLKNNIYLVDQSGEPKMIADNAMVLLEISDDGKSVAYLSDFDPQKETGDLYIARVDEGIEFVDYDVVVSTLAGLLGEETVNLSIDGNSIAYLKNFYFDRLWGDLYIKQKGEEPQKIDETVQAGFEFIK